jgi:hypothetical protein
VKKLDLTKPKDCREFLKAFKVDGRSVEFFELENGRKVRVDEMSDSELIQYAGEIYFNWLGGREGGGPVDTDIRGSK